MSRTASVTALTVTTWAAAALGQNVLRNPGFEDGLTSWSGTGGVRTGDPVPHGGLRYFFGGIGVNEAYAFQTLDLAAIGVTPAQVDSGFVELLYGGWQAGWQTQTDSGRIELAFLNESMTVISRVDLGWYYSNHTWAELSDSVIAPTGTRAVEYGFRAHRFQGNNNDGYLDDAYLIPSIVPAPGGLVVACIAGVALAGRRRG